MTIDEGMRAESTRFGIDPNGNLVCRAIQVVDQHGGAHIEMAVGEDHGTIVVCDRDLLMGDDGSRVYITADSGCDPADPAAFVEVFRTRNGEEEGHGAIGRRWFYSDDRVAQLEKRVAELEQHVSGQRKVP